MATSTVYQPRAKAPSFDSYPFSKSPTVDLCGQSKSPQPARPMSNADSVNLTTPNQDAHREDPVARDILEPPTARNPDTHGIRTGGACTSGVTDDNKLDQQDNDIGYESDTSSIPSLSDLLWGSESRGSAGPKYKVSTPVPIDKTGKEWCSEGDSEGSGLAAVTAAAGFQLSASKDTLIVLNNVQPVNTHSSSTPSDDTKMPMIEVTDLVPPSGTFTTLSGANAELDTNDNTRDSLAKDNIDNYTGDGEGGSKLHEDNALHTSILARGRNGNDYGGSSSGIGSDAPVSVGRIHNVFPGLEKDFGLLKSKRTAALSVCPDGETTADSIPRYISQREPQVVVDDGVADNWQASEAAEGDAARLSQRQIETAHLIDCALTVIFFNSDNKSSQHLAAFRDLVTPADIDIAMKVLDPLSAIDMEAPIDRLATSQIQHNISNTSELIKVASAVNQLRQSQGIQYLIPATTLHYLSQKIRSLAGQKRKYVDLVDEAEQKERYIAKAKRVLENQGREERALRRDSLKKLAAVQDDLKREQAKTENLKERLKCKICFNEEWDTMTGCGHLFCAKCIRDWLRRKPEWIEDDYGHLVLQEPDCPLCRKVVEERDLMTIFLSAAT